MAEQPAQDRTEEATPKKVEEARERGEAAKSIEVNSAVLLLSTMIFFYFSGEAFMVGVSSTIRDVYQNLTSVNLTPESAPVLARWIVQRGVRIIGPLMLMILVMALLVNYLQVGVIFAPKALVPKWERVNPLAGLKRILSSKGLAELIKGIFKMTLTGTIIYVFMSGRVKDYPFLTFMTPLQTLGILAVDIFKIGIYVGIGLLAMALADYIYQRWEYRRKLRMTKQEVKEETKQTEGSPEIRARIRQTMRELSRNRMMRDVAESTVVITNPVHVAIALTYDEASEEAAPTVVAKGQRKLAERIKAVARDNGIPVMEEPPLARALFDSCEVGTEIPYLYYKAVAEILAELYSHRGVAA